ncbi:MAG TPA: VWA domain-containing protein, partial [Cytophagaceae bacterium]
MAQKKVEPPKTTRILFILDASGSMTESWEGNTRMNVAKEVLSKIVDSLKTHKNLELALRVYGHEWDKKYNNCKDTKLEVPFKAGNHDVIKSKIKTVQPKGTTLISYSLEQCGNDFPVDKNSRNVIILLTDGIEACGGDPCALSLALQKKRIFLKPFIIGVGANEDFEKAFSCMGQYFDASDIKTFKNVFQKILTQTLKETTVKVNLLDINNKPTETNVNMTFVNTATNDVEYDFVHYLDDKGKTDNLKVDAILTYDIIVNTIPRVQKKGVVLKGGEENIISIKSPQGSLHIKDNYKDYKNLSALIRLDGQPATLNVQHAATKEKYLVGTYDVEVLTLPRT